MDGFLKNYELATSSDALNKNYIKQSEGKRCRYCSISYPQATFNTLPHVVPELFGKNSTSSNNECDSCNSTFQKYESDVSTMVQHYLSILNIKSKNGVPNFRSDKNPESRATSIKRTDDNLSIMFWDNLSDFKYDYEKKTMTLQLRTRKFVPFSIYKVLLKIGIALMNDEDIICNSHFLDFLHSETPIENGMQIWTLSRYILKTRYYAKPIAQLYKAKNTLIGNDTLPEYMLVLYFANVVMQLCLPISEKNCTEYHPDRKLVYHLFPAFALEDAINAIEIQHMDLREIRKVSITDSIVLYYDKLNRDVGGISGSL